MCPTVLRHRLLTPLPRIEDSHLHYPSPRARTGVPIIRCLYSRSSKRYILDGNRTSSLYPVAVSGKSADMGARLSKEWRAGALPRLGGQCMLVYHVPAATHITRT